MPSMEMPGIVHVALGVLRPLGTVAPISTVPTSSPCTAAALPP